MEWVTTTGRSIAEAKERALDQLGVAEDDAEFEILDEPRPGLFGRVRGEARVRARVRPTRPRPKMDRRDRKRGKRQEADAPTDGASPQVTEGGATDEAPRAERAGKGGQRRTAPGAGPGARGARAARSNATVEREAVAAPRRADDDPGDEVDEAAGDRETVDGDDAGTSDRPAGNRTKRRRRGGRGRSSRTSTGGTDDATSDPSDDDDQIETTRDRAGSTDQEELVDAQQVGEEARSFVQGLVDAFGLEGTATLEVDGDDLEVAVAGADLGLLVGPRGTTLQAVQELARVASQRRHGDHDTRLRVDVGGYRVRRREALTRFALDQAAQVVAEGTARALEPMSSSDRKVIHDALSTFEGVSTRSEGDDPLRRVVIAPARD